MLNPAKDPLDLLAEFLDLQKQSGLTPYPAQEEALLELASGKNVILNTPTGSGKSLVAAGLHHFALQNGKRSVYTCPIKALVNEKFLDLCRQFGPENVGLATGDGAVNSQAPILCCTAEILMNDALRHGSSLEITEVIMDEFHYFSDRERGVAWQVPLLTLPQARFLLMSATLGDTTVFEEGLTKLNGRETAVIRSLQRPVPLEFTYTETSLQETVTGLVQRGRAPVYIVNFTQAAAASVAQDLMSVDFCTKEEKRAIADFISSTPFNSPYGKELSRLIRHGIGIHHAGLLPRYRILVEKLAQKGLLKIIAGTDTLGVGVNVPIRTVLFTQLYKFDGEKTALLTARDFHQIAGRAGRRGYDDIGYVVAQAPEHVVENLKLEAKAGGDPKKLRKIVRKKPPEKGYVAYTKETLEKLIQAQPEALQSRFKVTHGMLLQVLSRSNEDGCEAMRQLVRASYETDHDKERHRRDGWMLFRSLVERDIIQLNPFQINVDLQEDFSLFQSLSLYLIDTLKLLDPQAPDYALDVLTLVESILENPEAVLRKQVDALKTEKLAELKAQGMEYEERMEELEKIEHPKPKRDFIYDSFNAFARNHPWVGQENIRPKSIARELYENLGTFSEYIRDYGLQRSEGLLLRYLSETYRTLLQSVPAQAKNEEIETIELYLGNLVRGVDASLIEEWEKLRGGEERLAAPASSTAAGQTLETAERTLWDVGSRGEKLLKLALRNEVFQVVRLIARRDIESILDRVELSNGVFAPNIDEQVRAYFAGHQRPRLDTPARAAEHFRIFEESPEVWRIEQTLIDPEDKNDWMVSLAFPVGQSRLERRIKLQWIRLGDVS
jgi:superfamily II RNA helicase